MSLYRTIVADPPWEYEPFVSINRTEGKWSERVEKPLPYPSMTLEEIAAIPVGDFADPAGAFLFVWTTNRYLPATFGLVERWGFTYRQTFVWHKVNGTPLGGGKVASSVLPIRHNAKTHSRKPDAFMDLIEAVAPGPYLELFARRQRLGWDTWGNEALEHVEVAS